MGRQFNNAALFYEKVHKEKTMKDDNVKQRAFALVALAAAVVARAKREDAGAAFCESTRPRSKAQFRSG